MLKGEGIKKRFRTSRGDAAALDGVSIEVEAGGRLGLVGPSGSGKSTLARVLALLLEPDSGEVSVDGEFARKWGVRSPRGLRRRVQLLWQSPRQAVDPRLRLEDVILEPLIACGDSPHKTDSLETWAERVGLTGDLLRRHPHEVSEGQLQRACLARALILEPGYLICDELSSMLDVSTQAALLEAIADEQERRELGVLMITHDRTLAEHWCEEVASL